MMDFTSKKVYDKGILRETFLINGNEVSEKTWLSLMENEYDKEISGHKKKPFEAEECECADTTGSVESEMCPRCDMIMGLIEELDDCEEVEEKHDVLSVFLDFVEEDCFNEGLVTGYRNAGQILIEIGNQLELQITEEMEEMEE